MAASRRSPFEQTKEMAAQTLEGAKRSTDFVVELEESTGFGKAPIHLRPYATHPAQTVRLPFANLRDGLLTADLPTDPASARGTLQQVGNDRPMYHDFEFVDNLRPAHGDYYYVRVT